MEVNVKQVKYDYGTFKVQIPEDASKLYTEIPKRLKCVNYNDPYVCSTEDIIDDEKGLTQDQINEQTENQYQGIHDEIHDTGGINDRLDAIEAAESITYEGGSAQIAQGSDFTNPDNTKRAKIPTVGAIIDGLNDGVYDVSKRNPTGGPNNDGKFTLEYILNNADTLIPISWRHGGMVISFIRSSDNKYVQYRLMSDTFNTTVANWQGVDDEPTAGSQNLVKSGGVYLLEEEERADSFNSILRDFEAVEVTADMLSELIWNNSTVQKSQSAYRSIIIKIDPTATYTWNINHAVLGFASIPKIGDSPQVIGQSLKELVNIEDYQYVMINLVGEGEIFSYSKNVTRNIIESYALDEMRDLLSTDFTKTDLLEEATILGGYYNALGQFVENADFASFEISVDNSVDLNKVFVYYTLMWNSTTLVPGLLFFNGITLISKYEDLKGKSCRVIPAGTTRIAFNLGNSYTPQRGDEFFIVSTNVLQHVAAAIALLKTKNQEQDNAVAELQESISEEIAELQEDLGQFNYYSDYIEVDKPTTADRISVYIDETKDIKSSQYEIKIDFTHPNGLTVFQLFKATTAHGGLESIGSNFVVGQTYTITKDDNKPVLYVYGARPNAQVDEYTVSALIYSINKDGISYQNKIVYNNSLANKKIVVFGDSLSEYIDSNGKTWSQHAQEITNVNITNVAIGGTQLRQRVPLVRLFKENVSYAVGDRVFYQPTGTTKMNCYDCINAHSGIWDANDFEEVSYTNHTYPYATLDIISIVTACCDINTPIEERFENQIAAAQCIKDHYPSDTNNPPIIERLAGIDWSNIDAVVILAGTNDYGENSNHGQSGSTDISKTMGAINEMVRLLCSTYKHLSLYYISPTVHWRDYSQGVGDPNKWCDVYMPAGEQMTRGQFYDSIINEFELNHIPHLNLYKELGWNKYNFSDYFWSDGTHPTKGKGFLMMAKKIVSYLAGNKTF